MSISADNISWKVGKKVIVDNVSLHISRGETVGLIGPNGCGKSSLLRILAGLRRPDAGSVTLDGQNIARIARKQNLSHDEAAKVVDDVDKARDTFVKNVADTSRHDARNYHIVLNMDYITEDQAVAMILSYLGK